MSGDATDGLLTYVPQTHRPRRHDILQGGTTFCHRRVNWSTPRTCAVALERRAATSEYSADPAAHNRQSDEEEASGHVGVMQAIISIFADERDKIRCVSAIRAVWIYP